MGAAPKGQGESYLSKKPSGQALCETAFSLSVAPVRPFHDAGGAPATQVVVVVLDTHGGNGVRLRQARFLVLNRREYIAETRVRRNAHDNTPDPKREQWGRSHINIVSKLKIVSPVLPLAAFVSAPRQGGARKVDVRRRRGVLLC